MRALLQHLGQRLLIDDRPARRVDEVGGRLHQREPLGIHQMARLVGQRAIHRQHVGCAEHVFELDQLDPQLAATCLVGIRIMGDELHVERLGQAEQLGADIADAERAQGAADQAEPMCWARRLKPSGPSRVRRSLIVSLPVSASISAMIDTATGRRTPSGVMTSGIPASGQGIDVDIVIADAEAGDHGEAAVGMDAVGGEARGQQDQCVEIGELVGTQAVGRLEIAASRRRAPRSTARDRSPGRSATRRLLRKSPESATRNCQPLPLTAFRNRRGHLREPLPAHRAAPRHRRNSR